MSETESPLFDYYRQSTRCRFNTLKGFFLQDLSMILYIRANGNYSDLYLMDGSVKIITHTLSQTEKILKNAGFKRVGRSLIINLNFLSHVDRQGGQCYLDLPDQTISLSVSQRHIRELSELF